MLSVLTQHFLRPCFIRARFLVHVVKFKMGKMIYKTLDMFAMPIFRYFKVHQPCIRTEKKQ